MDHCKEKLKRLAAEHADWRQAVQNILDDLHDATANPHGNICRDLAAALAGACAVAPQSSTDDWSKVMRSCGRRTWASWRGRVFAAACATVTTGSPVAPSFARCSPASIRTR